MFNRNFMFRKLLNFTLVYLFYRIKSILILTSPSLVKITLTPLLTDITVANPNENLLGNLISPKRNNNFSD